MRRWSTSQRLGRDGKTAYSVKVWNEPLWATAVENVTAYACEWSGGILGGHPRWQRLDRVMHCIPLGRPRWDTTTFPDYPILENSLAAKLADLESRLLSVGFKYETHGVHASLPIDEDTARALGVTIFDDDES